MLSDKQKFEQTGGLCHLSRHTTLPMDPRQMETLPTVMTRHPQTTRKNSRGHCQAPKHCNNPMQHIPITTQNDGSTILPSDPWLDEAYPTCASSLVWASVHPRQKSRCTTGNSRTNTIHTKMTMLPLDSQRKKQPTLNYSTMLVTA